VQEVALYNVALTTAASYTPQSAQTDPLAANLVALYGGGALEVDRVGVALTTSPGALAVSAKAATTATLTYGTTLGGTSPYTVALHRSTTSGFTPSGGTLVATNPTFPYTDTGLTTNTPYFYVVQVTDSTPVTPQVALSNQVWVVPNGNAANVFTPNDPALSWCPGGWKVTSAAAQTVGWGNYLLVAFFGTSLTLGVDTSAMSAGQYPTLLVSLDNAAPTTTTLTSSASVALISGKANTAHTARIYVQVQSVAADVWSTPVLTTKITSLTVDVGKTLDVAIPLANSFFFWGDSITQGLKASAAGAGDATLSFPYFIAELFNCEYGMSAFGGAGWTNTVATTNIPPFYTAGDSANTWWDKYWAGQSRLVGGLMVPTFTYAAVMLGQNTAPTSGQLQAWLSLFRAACPLTTLFIITTMSGQGRAVNSADISAYKAASHDNNVYLVDMSTITNFTTASILEILAADSHPQGRGYTHVAAYMYQKMTAALAPATVATAPGLVRIGHR
jgi:hypothetical protein